MRLLEELLRTSNYMKIGIIVVIIIDFFTLHCYDILDIKFSNSNSPVYNSQFIVFLSKSLLSIILSVLILIFTMKKAIVSLIFASSM